MIRLENVKKQYKNFQLDCSLEVKAGRITGLVGENGAGKSTTFKAILGLIKLDDGRVELLGKDINSLRLKDKEELGVVLAESGFSGYLTVKDLLPALAAFYKKFDKEVFVKKCAEYKIPLDKKIKEFSTGMKTKLKILVALSHDAKLLILDEPTSGLDVVVRDELLGMLQAYMEAGNRSILISSHISSDLETICDDFYMIHDGKIVLHEDTDKLLSSYGIVKASPEQYETMDKAHILKVKKESYGYRCLTNERQFYLDNYPDIVIEKGNLDEMILLMIRGQ